MPDDVYGWLRRRPLSARVVIYAALAVSAFALSIGAGALGAAMLRGELVLPGGNESRAVGGRAEVSASQGNNDPDKAVQEGDGRERGDSSGAPLWEALRGCEQSQEACARDFVADVAPSAEYAGGRIDTDDSGRTRHVLYFVDPDKAPCEYKIFEGSADGSDHSGYVVLVAGEGSFSLQQQEGDGAGCLPEL